jgi:ATP-binding cassette, subfamily B, putative efflux pump
MSTPAISPSRAAVDYRSATAEAALLMRDEWRPLLGVTGLVALNRVAALGPALASKVVVDRVIGAHRLDLMLPLALALLTALAVEATSGYALSRASGIASQRTVTRLRTTLYSRVVRLPVGFFDGGRSGWLLSRLITDPETVREVLGPALVQLLSGVLTAMLATAVLVQLDWRVATAVLTIVVAFLAVLTARLTRLSRAFRVATEQTDELTSHLAEVLGGIRVVKTFRAERREALAFTRESHRLHRTFAGAFDRVGVIVALSVLATGLVNGGVLVLVGRDVAAGSLTVGGLVLYLFMVGLVTAPLLQISAHLSELGRAAAALRRIAELKAVATEDDRDSGLASLTQTNGAVAFERVSYAYTPARWGLRDVSFAAEPGTTVAIVGLNGSGKSTTLCLLGGLARPTAGRIVVDGRDLAGVRLRAWRNQVSAVLQEPYLFDGTIADNIAYGRPGATSADIARAGCLAHCEEFVRCLPAGYATRVGERGTQLSGGQRQRVAIARALLADPQILLLDEPTSNLDHESEAFVQDALRTLRAGRTTFVVAHRLATVRNAARVLVLERGALVEQGTHEELIARRGTYWRLVVRQAIQESWLSEATA